MGPAEKTALRDVIGEHIAYLGAKDERIVVVSADMVHTCRLQPFAERFPDRIFHVGIAEQDLISFSAGLALEGALPFAFSMAPFISMRACEQCRTDVAYGNLNVRMVSVYAGVSGGISGVTHWGMEDCAILGAMPNMTLVEPSDPVQARRLLDLSLEHQGPLYLRCTVAPTTPLYGPDASFALGKAVVVEPGDDGAFLCSGVTVQFALEAARRLERSIGKHIRVVDMCTVRPVDREAVLSAADTGYLIAAQDHFITGGLGYAVASILAENGVPTRFRILGIPDSFVPIAHAPYLYHQFGYDADGLEQAMTALLESPGAQ